MLSSLTISRFQGLLKVIPTWRPSSRGKKTYYNFGQVGGKFTTKWDGPYVVQEAYSHYAYKLVDADSVKIGPTN